MLLEIQEMLLYQCVIIIIFPSKKVLIHYLMKIYVYQWQDTDNLYENKKKPLSLISSWDKHFLSWNKYVFDCPKLLIKFEDLVYDKKNTIKKIIDFFIKNYNFNFSNLDKKIENMISYSNFNHLKKTEQKNGFDEAVNDNFFNKGTKEQWLDKLSNEADLSYRKILL